MKTILSSAVLGLAGILALTGCGVVKAPAGPTSFKLSFGQASTVDVVVPANSKATVKEYKLAITGALKK